MSVAQISTMLLIASWVAINAVDLVRSRRRLDRLEASRNKLEGLMQEYQELGEEFSRALRSKDMRIRDLSIAAERMLGSRGSMMLDARLDDLEEILTSSEQVQ